MVASQHFFDAEPSSTPFYVDPTMELHDEDDDSRDGNPRISVGVLLACLMLSILFGILVVSHIHELIGGIQ